MSKKTLFTTISIISIIVIGFVLYTIFAPKEQFASPNSPSPTVSPTVSPSVSPSPSLLEDNKEEDKKDAEKIGTVDKKDITPMEGFSDTEIQEATKFISDYSYAVHNNEYFLGGEWAKDGSKVKNIQVFLNGFYSKEIIDELDKLEGKQGSEEFAEKMTSLVPFFDETDTYKPSEYCSSDKNREPSNEVVENNECVSDLKLSEIKFNSIKNGEAYNLRAEFSVTSKASLFSKELNADAYTNVDYHYVLNLEKHILGNDKFEWEIVGYDIIPSLSNINQFDAVEGNND